MAKLLIGADIDAGTLRVVCLEQDRQGERLRFLARRPVEDMAMAAAELQALIEAREAAGARIALALPEMRLFSRDLEFPFADRRKIAQSAPLALASRLPGESSGRLIVTLSPRPADGGANSLALSLPEAAVAEALAPFDARQLPVRVLDLHPFVEVATLAATEGEGVLVLLRAQGGVVVRYSAGQPQQHLLLPDLADGLEAEAAAIVAAVHSLPGVWPPPAGVLLAGPGATPDLQRALLPLLPEARVVEIVHDGERLAAEYLPALALARRAGQPGRGASCNLRRGPYAYRGSLAPFRRSLIAASSLLALALIAAVAGTWLGYAGKKAQLAQVEKELLAIYQQSLPGAPPVADIPLYLARKLGEMQEQGRLLGGGVQPPLAVLDAVSQVVAELPAVTIGEWDYDEAKAQLGGQASSFDEVDRLAARLQDRPLFAAAQIAEVKSTLDGKQVDFRISLSFASDEEAR